MTVKYMELHVKLNDTKKLWWLHDSYWHATAVRELGEAHANKLNLEANELFFRKYTLMLLIFVVLLPGLLVGLHPQKPWLNHWHLTDNQYLNSRPRC